MCKICRFSITHWSLKWHGNFWNIFRYPKDSREGGHNPRTFDADAPGALRCENEKTAAKFLCDYDSEPCLYDVIQDPCEYRNIAGENPFIVDFLLAKLSRFNQTALPSIGLPPDPRAKAAVNDGLCQPWDTHSNWAWNGSTFVNCFLFDMGLM